MNETGAYAVFLFPQALEVLGEAIKPYLLDSPAGAHILCREIDTGGALIEMTIDGHTADGRAVALELMVPTSMVRMIVSAHSDGAFGFGPRIVEPSAVTLPPVGPTGTPAAPPQETPTAPDVAPSEAPDETLSTQTPPKP